MKKFILLISCLVSMNTLANDADKQHCSEDSALPYYQSAEFTPHWLQDNEIKQTFHTVSPFRLTNQLGHEVTEQTFEGKIYVASFFFTTCPGICPKMRSQLSKVQQAFIENDNVLILSHSIQPSNDTVDVLNEYAIKNDVKSDKWHLVTGQQEDIYRLAREDYFANEDLGEYTNNNDFLHTENLVLVDKNKHIRGIYNGLNNTSVTMLLEDIKTLINHEK